MITKMNEFKPGDKVPTSGIYDVIHDKLDGEDHAHFRLHEAAEPVEAHDHFKR